MAFISKKASALVSGSSKNKGGYLSASKLGDGESMRFAICSEEPLESWTVWGESDEGQKKPFRFLEEPSSEDIAEKLGDYNQRMNYEGTDLEKPKFSINMFVFDYADDEIKVLEIGQRTLIKELDKISQTEDYEDLHIWDFEISRTGTKMSTEYKLLPMPRKKGYTPKIAEAWDAAMKSLYNIYALVEGESPFGEKV